ncbi:hypothetical protein [Vibrio mediterranei]|jgi:hypothetical protein|uniref:hypothetical protein n=1 Tax=Vibrio mediterranei TaxID=689 RepID=UPI002284FD07|nr:hypothetical protein [Vibrio mediterranei]MCY9855668.1 hypothetical protein [Vibrio mediterranei]
MSARNLSELLNTTLLMHSEKLSNLDRDTLTGFLSQLNRDQALSDKQMKLCQKLVLKTNQACVFIHDTSNVP